MSESAVSAKVRLGSVWRETGAVRNARPSRGQAAYSRKGTKWNQRRHSLPSRATGPKGYGVYSTRTIVR